MPDPIILASAAHDKMTSLIIRVMTVVTVASLSVIWRQHSVSVSLSHDLYPSLIIDLSEATHKLTFWFIFLWYNYCFMIQYHMICHGRSSWSKLFDDK